MSSGELPAGQPARVAPLRAARCTVPELLAARAQAAPDRVALLVPGRSELTFAEWDQRSNELARQLLDRGLGRGDRVGLLFANRDWVDYAISYCAVQKAGGVAVPISDRMAPAEVQYMLTHCAAVAVLHGDGITPPSGAAWSALPGDLRSSDRSPVGIVVGPADPAQILYTSGTTGRPKGVAATHANLTHGCQPAARHRRLAHSEYFLHAFPVGTNAGQTMLVNALDAHPTALVVTRFTAGHVGRMIESYRVGTVFVVPAMAIELLNSRVHERHDLSSIRLLGSTAAALPPSVATALAEALPRATIVNYYTSTEAAPAQTTMIFDPTRPASVGRAVDGALMVAGQEGQALPVGAVGEVCLRSPTTPRSYYRDDVASREVFRDGWVRMGDVGYLDDGGYLYLVDRDRDVIKSGAFKVSTLQVEAALFEHPAVADGAVFGVPHPVLGTAVVAAVVLRAGRESALTTLGELREFLADRLAEHEFPTRVLLVGDLPRNPGGKVLKRELQGLAADRTVRELRPTAAAAPVGSPPHP